MPMVKVSNGGSLTVKATTDGTATSFSVTNCSVGDYIFAFSWQGGSSASNTVNATGATKVQQDVHGSSATGVMFALFKATASTVNLTYSIAVQAMIVRVG